MKHIYVGQVPMGTALLAPLFKVPLGNCPEKLGEAPLNALAPDL